MYTDVRKNIRENGEKALPHVLGFMSLPPQMFAPYALPVSAAANQNAIKDSSIYYAHASELYHKVMVLLDLVDFPDQKSSYKTAMDALLATRAIMKSMDIGDPQLLEFLVGIYEECIAEYKMTCMVLVAPAVCPKPVRAFSCIDEAISFVLTSADTLWHLTRVANPSAYINSGFVDEAVKNMPQVGAAYGHLLAQYCEKVDLCINHGC